MKPAQLHGREALKAHSRCTVRLSPGVMDPPARAHAVAPRRQRVTPGPCPLSRLKQCHTRCPACCMLCCLLRDRVLWRVLWRVRCQVLCLVPAVLLALCAEGAGAAQVPQATGDAHVRQVPYRADQVVRVIAQRGFATHIALDPAEHILVVAPGDRDGWQVVAREGDHDVYLKPQLAAHDSNLEIRTDVRSYSLELVVLPLDAQAGTGAGSANQGRPASRQTMYRVTFTYARDGAALAAAALLGQRLAQAPVVRNARYSMQVMPHSEDIVPVAAWDDGRFTYIRIPANRRIPAVFAVGDDNTERVVDRHMDDGLIVVHEVARRFVLRLGDEVVGLWNDAFDLDGVPPEDGTTVQGVKRVLRGSDHE